MHECLNNNLYIFWTVSYKSYILYFFKRINFVAYCLPWVAVSFCITFLIYNGNWAEWSAIWAEIIHVISKSNEHVMRVRFKITSMISNQNCMTWGSITTLLHPFWNHPNSGFGQFKYFIDVVLSWFEIKFIHFLGQKNKSFENKSCEICHMILFVFHFLAIWLVTLNKPWNLMGCFVFSEASTLPGEKMWFNTKNGAIHE